MRTRGHIGAMLAAASLGMVVAIKRADDDLDERSDNAPPAPAPTPTEPSRKAHKHSREIARRLRQEARKAEKEAARTPLQAGCR